VSAVLDYLPKGNTLSDKEWHRRHRLLQWLLAAHLPALFVFGVARGFSPNDVTEALALPLACLLIGHLMRSRRLAASFITLGLVYCSAALVGFSNGAIEAHFHFFIIIGFIALYQDWVPFLLNIVFTVLSHGIGSSLVPDLMFNHASAQEHPWRWSLIHGGAVLAASVGVVLFWKNTEEEQNRSLALTKQLTDAEISRRRFTSELLVNLARRNQNLLYRQLDLLNDLEDKERDPDALADLFRLDHLATRIRRNAENLLVLSGEESPRTWREPVALADVMRAAIAEIEDLDRVDESVDEMLSVSGRSVADLTHLFAELLENAVHFSPPGVTVVVRSRPQPAATGTQLVTIEDWGVGMTPAELVEANEILRHPREVDLSVSQRLGLHVVARLAQRYGISVELTGTPGGGVTAVATLPPSVFERSAELVGAAAGRAGGTDAGRWPASPAAFTPGYDDASGPDGTADLRRPTPFQEPHPSSPEGFDLGGRTGGAPEVQFAARPAIEAPAASPARPRPPLPPDPIDGAAPLPRRERGDAMARGLRGTPEPFAPDPGRANGHAGNGRVVDGNTAAEDGWSSWWTRSAAPVHVEPHRTAPVQLEPQSSTPVQVEPYPSTPVQVEPHPSTPVQVEPHPTAPVQLEPHPTAPVQVEPAGIEPSPEPATGSVPVPEPRPPVDDGGTPQLRRRVPQANLAAGLRREAGAQPDHDETPVVRDPMAARNALSRFQAAQRAARDEVDGDRTEGGQR
jgi:signal transduction histidine kinase